MEHVTRAACFSKLQSAMVRGAPYTWLPYTTLNEKFGVLPGEYPPASVYPTLSVITLGRGGLKMGLDADGEPTPEIMQHKSTDTALFKHMPFVLRLPENDLPAERRARYCLRTQLPLAGKTYWAYYGRRQDFSQADTDMYIKHVLPDGSVQTENWVPDESNLNPTPVDLSESGTNLLAGYSVVASTIIALGLDSFDINEIRNASQIIKNATGKALVSEIAICTSAFKTINAPSQNGTFPFQEAVGCQVASFIQALYALDFLNTGLTDQLELGISEPLFRLEGVNQP